MTTLSLIGWKLKNYRRKINELLASSFTAIAHIFYHFKHTCLFVFAVSFLHGKRVCQSCYQELFYCYNFRLNSSINPGKNMNKYQPKFKPEFYLKFLEHYEVHSSLPGLEHGIFYDENAVRVEVNGSKDAYPLKIFRGNSFLECLEQAILETGFEKELR